jgi:hypothetical protein
MSVKTSKGNEELAERMRKSFEKAQIKGTLDSMHLSDHCEVSNCPDGCMDDCVDSCVTGGK